MSQDTGLEIKFIPLTMADYKKWHKPITESEKVKFKQGYYHPMHPEKCLSKINIYRSGWELFFCQYCDRNESIVRWASEPVSIQYYNPVANLEKCKAEGKNPQDPRNWKLCNYHTDFWIEVLSEDKQSVKKIFIEIKPYAQTQPPKPISETASIKEHRAYNRQAETYLVNQAKWKAATKQFGERGCQFMVVTERSLQKLGMNL